jgi:adenylylsulfate kinase
MMDQEIKIRFNTEKDKADPNLPAWRVLISGVEHLAESIKISAPCWTTRDEISPGIIKWHISCFGTPVWNGRNCTIEKPAEKQTEKPTRPGVIWLTGLPAAGKSSIAKVLGTKLRALGYKVEELDGDAIREVFPSTGFSRADRDQHIRRVGYMASRLEAQGVVVVASLISPFEDSRLFVRKLCKNYFEVFVNTPLEVCESRDPKGLYKKARAGLIQAMTGIDDPYEIPAQPHLVVNTLVLNPDEAADEIMNSFL